MESPAADPTASRFLVIHADDFGMSHSVNLATAEAFENGWITSASVMVPCPWFPEVAAFARRRPEACLGIHLTLNSEWTGYRWGPVGPRGAVASLVDADGYFPLLETDVIARARMADVEAELGAQIEKARAAGIAITHFDAHMGTLFGSRDLFAVYLGLGERYAMPTRVADPPAFFEGELAPPAKLIDAMCEVTPAAPPDLWLEAYKEVLASLPPGSFQLTVHLGFDDDEMRGATEGHPNWGAAWRQRDFDVVRSAEFRRFLKDEGFVLVSWRDLARRRLRGV